MHKTREILFQIAAIVRKLVYFNLFHRLFPVKIAVVNKK
jgi:hypothetical protein